MALVGGNLIIYLTADTRQFEAGMSKATGYLDSFQGAAKIAAGILMRDLARGLAQGAAQSLKMGAQIKTLEASFKSLSQATSDYVPSLDELREATDGMVSDTDLLLRANEALALGIPTEHLDDLFDSAVRLGKAMGIDATQGIQALTIGVGRQSRLVLDNLGIIVRAESSYEEYAKRVGKSTDALTENERRIAFQTVALEKITEKAAILGDNISDTDKSMMRWTATIKNLSTSVGQFLQPLGALAPAIETLGPGIGIMGATLLPTLSAATLGWVAAAGLAIVGVVGLISAFRDYERRMDTVGLAQDRVTAAMMDTASASQALEDAEHSLEMALSTQETMYDALSTAIDRRAEASERLVEAENNLKDAENELAAAQQDLSAFLTYLSGDVEEYIAVTGGMEYATLAAQTGITAFSTELQTLQGVVAATSAELAGLQGEMTGLSDEEQELNLRLLKVTDAFRDGRITEEEYTERADKLRGKLRDLNITQAELTIQIRDTRREEEEQIKTLEDVQENLDDLIAKNEEVVTAQEDVDTATDDVTDARDAEIDAITDVEDALTDLETAHDSLVVAQDAVRDSNYELESSLRAIERATNDLSEAESQRALDQTLRQQERGWVGGVGREDVNLVTGGTTVTTIGPTTSTTVNLNVNMTAPTSSPEAQQYADEFIDLTLQELGRRGVTR